MIDAVTIEFLKRLAKGLSAEFGEDCEIVIHDLTGNENSNGEIASTVVAIENGHVSGRAKGDGPSQIVLEALKSGREIEDHLCYLTKTADGRILRSSTIFIRDAGGYVTGIFAINYDITKLMVIENTVKSLIGGDDDKNRNAMKISSNVNDLLEELIEESVRIVGKPVAMMTKEDKVRAIGFLNKAGAFLITRSGDKVSNYFGISKFTLYNYMDESTRKE